MSQKSWYSAVAKFQSKLKRQSVGGDRLRSWVRQQKEHLSKVRDELFGPNVALGALPQIESPRDLRTRESTGPMGELLRLAGALDKTQLEQVLAFAKAVPAREAVWLVPSVPRYVCPTHLDAGCPANGSDDPLGSLEEAPPGGLVLSPLGGSSSAYQVRELFTAAECDALVAAARPTLALSQSVVLDPERERGRWRALLQRLAGRVLEALDAAGGDMSGRDPKIRVARVGGAGPGHGLDAAGSAPRAVVWLNTPVTETAGGSLELPGLGAQLPPEIGAAVLLPHGSNEFDGECRVAPVVAGVAFLAVVEAQPGLREPAR
jgi:hypothetical protein